MKVVIVEDHAMIGGLLAELCRRDFRFDVTATAGLGAEGLAAVRRCRPDLVLLDVSLPDLDGLDIAETIRRELPATRILVLSSMRDARTLMRLRALGVHGFFDKREPTFVRLAEAIRRVSEGGAYFSPVVGEVLGSLRGDPHAFHRLLSDYEQRILGLIGESKSDGEIAASLGVKASTVQSRRRDIMNKLGIHRTPKLIRFAIENGFARPEHFRAGTPANRAPGRRERRASAR
ncbi:MAG: response regulator [Opitutaceae bacterium]